MRLSSTSKNPCGPLAGIRDRDRRPCEGSSQASATQPVASARTASQSYLIRAGSKWSPISEWLWDVLVRSVRAIYLPDIDCAKPRRGSAFLPDGCAMISHSGGQRARLIFKLRVAGRSTPMTGIERSNLSYRAILILLVLLGTPIAARSDTLEESAQELARKIEAALPARDDVTVEVRNLSSLMPEELARVEQALKVELQSRGVRAPLNGAATVSVLVTLSENLRSFVWTAEIRQGDASRVVLMAVPRSLENRAASHAMPTTLRSERFWEGPEHLLDAGIVPDSRGGAWRVLLLPDGVVIQETGNGVFSKVEIPSAQTSTRDPKGSLALLGDAVVAKLEPQVCTVMLETRTLAECHSALVPPSARDPLDLGPSASLLPEKESRAVLVRNQCGQNQQFLVTGGGDDTQPDSVQLYESQGLRSFPVSDPLNFAGAVVALHAYGPDPTATGIVRNLETGNYEAYRLSISCGQ
jgi:hypothetical protein